MRPRLRSLLGAFLFSGDEVDKPIGVLSGGEKARVALAKMLVWPSNLLLLDEPTNHLDLKSREVLEDALDEYEGTLVVISHDRYFINRVATSIGEVGEGRIDLRAGDYDDYLERRSAGAATAEAALASGARGGPRDDLREQRRLEAEQRNRRYRERKAVEARLAPVEAEITALESRLQAIEADQADPAVYRDAERARQLGRERQEAAARLEALYTDWERLAASASSERA
jgi:ATP-binding cassette subfamily F protein 3